MFFSIFYGALRPSRIFSIIPLYLRKMRIFLEKGKKIPMKVFLIFFSKTP
jgi:hypothetical protein